jgi:hypothetical protein
MHGDSCCLPLLLLRPPGVTCLRCIDFRFFHSKGEVMNLLESAGFSRSNPYYVVQQGKVRIL